MIITYYGAQSFKIQHGDLTIAYNPTKEAPDKSVRIARFGADIALVSANHPHFNGTENLSVGAKEPFVINGPGEYETKGVYIKGTETFTKYGGDDVERLNTIYYVLVEGIRLLFLGALDSPKLNEKTHDEISEVDILFVPVGESLLTPAEAHKLSLSFSPKIIIPMQYTDASLKKFLEEAGQEKARKEEKLTLKKKDLDGKQGEVVVLKTT